MVIFNICACTHVPEDGHCKSDYSHRSEYENPQKLHRINNAHKLKRTITKTF